MSRQRRGKKHSPEWIRNRFESFRRFWDKKGRVSSLYALVKASVNYREWRRLVFERDKYTCQGCGDKRGGNLEPHHVIPFRVLLEGYKNGLVTLDRLHDVSNGITLCHPCHKKTPSYGRKFNIIKESIT